MCKFDEERERESRDSEGDDTDVSTLLLLHVLNSPICILRGNLHVFILARI
jgi:hypothetical protein